MGSGHSGAPEVLPPRLPRRTVTQPGFPGWVGGVHGEEGIPVDEDSTWAQELRQVACQRRHGCLGNVVQRRSGYHGVHYADR